jgi:FkbM family methyltransferase
MRRRLGREYSYEAMQLEVERRLHHYLHVDAESIEQIVIVGANDGGEIPRLRLTYPRSRFLCFEPSPVWYNRLTETFRQADYVENRKLALSDCSGSAIFHELPLAGNGSLLPPDREHWSSFSQIKENEVTSFEVAMSTLDHEAKGLKQIDLLWIDVQGAEGSVLKGGIETLRRVAAVFLEVALIDSPYRGALLFPQLQTMLTNFGFFCVGLGVDGWNYSGNSLWIRNLAQGRSI